MADSSRTLTWRAAARFSGHCLVLGGFVLPLLWVTIPVEPVPIDVRWTGAVADAERIDLERRFYLADGRLGADATWNYALFDYSRDNIRALVMHPGVVDTHQVNRSTFQPDNPPLGWLARILVCAALFAVAGAAGMTALAGTLNIVRFWVWTTAVALVLVALRASSVDAIGQLLASAPWLPVSAMLITAIVASLDYPVTLSPRTLATVVAVAPLIIVIIGTLMLGGAAFGCSPPWSAR